MLLPVRNGHLEPLGVLLRLMVFLSLGASWMKGIDSLDGYFLIPHIQLWGVLLEFWGPLRVKLIVVEE
jgi:hypothetical protein